MDKIFLVNLFLLVQSNLKYGLNSYSVPTPELGSVGTKNNIVGCFRAFHAIAKICFHVRDSCSMLLGSVICTMKSAMNNFHPVVSVLEHCIVLCCPLPLPKRCVGIASFIDLLI